MFILFFLLAKRVERNCVIEMETNLINMLSYIVLWDTLPCYQQLLSQAASAEMW